MNICFFDDIDLLVKNEMIDQSQGGTDVIMCVFAPVLIVLLSATRIH
jgi:hypothetical protein